MHSAPPVATAPAFQLDYHLYAPDAGVPDIEGCDFALFGDQLLCTPEVLPVSRQVAQAHFGAPQRVVRIGTIAGQPCHALLWPALAKDAVLPDSLQFQDLRRLSSRVSAPQFLAAIRARQLAIFLRDHAFCGRCGSATTFDANEPAARCPACAHLSYPRLSPAVMVLIRRGDELLLARSPHFQPGMYSALAGFVEAGESVEACIHREVMEEVGVQVGNLRWFGSQSWPFPHSLMLAFQADWTAGELRPAPGEIEDAQWFSPATLPLLPHPSSIAHSLIQAALAERNAA